VIEVIPEARAFLFLATDHLHPQLAVLPQEVTQARQQVRVLGKTLHQDVTGAIQRRLRILNTRLSVEVVAGQHFRILTRVIKKRIRQRFQPRLPGDLALGSALGLVGQVEILQPTLGVRRIEAGQQFVGQLALLPDGLNDGGAPVLHLPAVTQPLIELAQLAVIQRTGDFLAVTGDEGNRRALVQQGHGGIHLALADAQFIGNGLID